MYGSTANLYVDRHGDYIGYGPESSELVGIPDPETFCQLPWDKRVARVFCTCFRNREERENPGGHLTSDCRGNLRIIHNEFQEKYDGLHLRCGTEPEMMWLKRGEDGRPNGGVTKPNCYHIDQFEELRPTFMKVIEYSQAMGLDIIQGDHEDAPGQLELNTMFDDVVRNADSLTTYRQICAQVAREDGLIACFMSKPFMGVSASGCHHNMSLWRGGKDTVNDLHFDKLPGMAGAFTYLVGGDNTFMPDPSIDERKPGPIGLQCIGGVMKHLGSLDFHRFFHSKFLPPISGILVSGLQFLQIGVIKTALVHYGSLPRVVLSTVLWIRWSIPTLMGAALLKAFDDGISNDLDPGEAEERNIYQAIEEGKQVKKLPMSLGEALQKLADDEVIKSSMPDEMYRVFHHYKNDEWEKFNHTVTDWDLETYIDCLP